MMVSGTFMRLQSLSHFFYRQYDEYVIILKLFAKRLIHFD